MVGTTGESPTVSMDENCEIIRVAVEQAAGRVPIMAGTGANSTSEAIELTRYAKKVGADCHLSVVPYYNRPSQEGIYQHFPCHRRGGGSARWCCTTCPAARSPTWPTTPSCGWRRWTGIIGLKDATGDIDRAAWLIKQLPKSFSLYSGDDGTAVALMLLGGRGNVSVTANVAPRLMHELCMAAIEGQVRRASEIHLQLLPLHRDLFCEPSPAPTKWAMAQLGLCGPALRLPIVPLTAAGEATVAQALRDTGLR